MIRNLPSHGGAWTPAGPAALTHVKNVEGIGAVLKDWKVLPQSKRKTPRRVAGPCKPGPCRDDG